MTINLIFFHQFTVFSLISSARPPRPAPQLARIESPFRRLDHRLPLIYPIPGTQGSALRPNTGSTPGRNPGLPPRIVDNMNILRRHIALSQQVDLMPHGISRHIHDQHRMPRRPSPDQHIPDLHIVDSAHRNQLFLQ